MKDNKVLMEKLQMKVPTYCNYDELFYYIRSSTLFRVIIRADNDLLYYILFNY